jgi:hypothetical protein
MKPSICSPVALAALYLGLAGCGSGSSAGGTTAAGGASGHGGATGSGGAGGSVIKFGTGGTAGSGGTRGGGGAGGSGGQSSGQGGASCQPFTTDGFATVAGPTFGAALLADSDLRKSITARDTTANPAFSVGSAWVVDPTRKTGTSFSTTALVFISITNRSSSPACGVALSNVTYRDASGVDVSSQYGALATGNVAAQTAQICSLNLQGMPDCLATGQTSWSFHNLSYVGADLTGINIASVDFALTSNTAAHSYGEPGYRIAAQSYTVDTAANGSQTLNIVLKNLGPAAARLDGLAEILALDANGTPLLYSSVSMSGTLQPQQSITVSKSNLVFDGSSTRLVVLPWSSGVL